jgi:hypothetical protein
MGFLLVQITLAAYPPQLVPPLPRDLAITATLFYVEAMSRSHPDRPGEPRFSYSANQDVNDGKVWSQSDDHELTAAAKCGATLYEAASLLCRKGSLYDVGERARKLGLSWRASGRTPHR